MHHLCLVIMDVELRHLRAFTAVAENLSFTAASRHLLLTQPALTRTIQQLERSLEIKLLERTSRSVQLTDAGRAFLARSQGILRDFDLAVAEARGERDLRIGFSWVLPDPWASDVVDAFEETTGAAARLMRRDDLAAALERGDVDVALSRHDLAVTGATSLALFDEPRVAAVSSRSPLTRRKRFTWEELGEHTMIINTGSGSTRPDQWGEDRRPSELIECDNYDEWVALIAADRGVGAIAQSAATATSHTGIAFIPLDDAPPATLRLTWRPSRSGALVRRFIEAATRQGGPQAR